MTYQYQEVKKTEEKPQEEKKQTDLFDYEQQHQEILNTTKGEVVSATQQTKEQQTKKGETGYEPDSSEETRISHNKKMEELYGAKSTEKVRQQNANNEKSHYATDEQEEKARQHNKKEGERIKQQQQINPKSSSGLKSELFFPTAIHRGSLPIADKINPLLIKHCYKLKKEWEESGEPKLNRSVKGGWQSKPTIHDLPELEDSIPLETKMSLSKSQLSAGMKRTVLLRSTCLSLDDKIKVLDYKRV